MLYYKCLGSLDKAKRGREFMKNLKNGVKAGKRNIMFFQLGLNMNNFQNKTSHSFDFSYLMVAISSIRCPALAISLV
jgi:DNA-binding sugar fermentation-stimulating protein